MSIGTTIKRLRREKDITQEQLAEYLGITSRAISQWECDRTTPDISLLPALANIFEVSSDELLGIDVNAKQKKIDAIYKQAMIVSGNGQKEHSIAILEAGLKEYPDSYKLMELYATRNDSDNTLYHIEKAAEYAVEFDTFECSEKEYSSLLTKGTEKQGVWWEDSTNRSYNLLTQLSKEEFRFLNNYDWFDAIKHLLKMNAKD